MRIVFTDTHSPSCVWSGLTTYQFATSSGVAFGQRVSIAAAKGLAVPVKPWNVNNTFQVVQNIVTEEGVLCSQKQATFVAVTSPGHVRLMVKLPSSIEVCVNGTTKWTSVSSLSFPKPSTCTETDLKLSLGQSDGTAGTIFYPLSLRTSGSKPARSTGPPIVQPPVQHRGVAPIVFGPPATVRNVSVGGYGDAIRLAPGAKASAAFGVVETGNFTPSQCVARDFENVSVELSGIGTWIAPLSSTTCTKLASTNISELSRGLRELRPKEFHYSRGVNSRA